MSSILPKNSANDQSKRQQLTEQLTFLGQMGSTETALFHQRVAESAGLNVTDTKAMSVLMQEGVLTAGELALRLQLTTGAVTSVIDRLEDSGFLKRRADPKDRRKVILELDKRKVAQNGEAYASIGRSFVDLLTHYSTEQLELLVDFYQRTTDMTRLEIDKLSRSGNKSRRS